MWDHDGSLSAIVDGENANFVEASRLLDRASQVEMVEEVSLPTPAPAPIGNPVAHQLHGTLGRLGSPWPRGAGPHGDLLQRTQPRLQLGLAVIEGEDAEVRAQLLAALLELHGMTVEVTPCRATDGSLIFVSAGADDEEQGQGEGQEFGHKDLGGRRKGEPPPERGADNGRVVCGVGA